MAVLIIFSHLLHADSRQWHNAVCWRMEELLYADCLQQFSALKFVLPLLFLVWLQAIKNRHWYFTRTHWSGKTIHFVLECQGKVGEN